MDYKEYLKEELEKHKEKFWGLQAEGYENGMEISEDTKDYPREKDPYIDIKGKVKY